MKVIECSQGSQEWLAARAGRITASNFRVARERLRTGKNAGEPTAACRKYALQLAIERITGEPLNEGYETWQMRRGHELEPDARIAHQGEINEIVRPCGFVTTDDGVFGCSLDGWIGDKGGSEYKCLVSSESLYEILIEHDPEKYMDQVQGQLWITGLEWVDFCVYYPGLAKVGKALWRRRVKRDDDHIETMERQLMEFKRMVDSYEAKLRGAA